MIRKVSFAEIDWHDYAIVQTIEFTAADTNSELPTPMSVQEVENMTLAQKRMAAMIMETTAEEVEAHRARQAAAEAEAAAAVGTAGAALEGDGEDAMMEESDDEDDSPQPWSRKRSTTAAQSRSVWPHDEVEKNTQKDVREACKWLLNRDGIPQKFRQALHSQLLRSYLPEES